MIVKNGSLTLGSAEILSISTGNLIVGMNIYGTGIPPCAKILTIDSGVKLTMNYPATATGVNSLQFTSANPGLYLERCNALTDIKNVVDERGDFIKVILRSESDVSRDPYNSISKRNQNSIYTMKAYPIETRPSQKQLEKAGIREQADIVVWTAMKDWITAGVDFNDIEFGERSTIVWNGNVYEIRDKNVVNQIADTFLYITLGLFKR